MPTQSRHDDRVQIRAGLLKDGDYLRLFGYGYIQYALIIYMYMYVITKFSHSFSHANHMTADTAQPRKHWNVTSLFSPIWVWDLGMRLR